MSSFRGPFQHQFSAKHQNLFNCNKYVAKRCFRLSRPSILASRIHHKIMFFRDAFQDTLLSDFITLYTKLLDWGTSSKSSGHKTETKKSTKWRQNAELKSYPVLTVRVARNARTWRNAQWIGPSFCLCFFVARTFRFWRYSR